MKIQTNLLLRLRHGFIGMMIVLLLAAGWPASQASAASTSSIAAGRGPHAVAVNPATNRVYIANADSDSVTVLEDTYKVAVAQMAESGIMTGQTEKQFVPQDLATRAQAAVVVKRMLQTAGFMN